jgi:hypothetical protein
MTCDFKRNVPGDCHVQCIRNFKTGDMIPYKFVKRIRDIPAHAGIYPICFNDHFVCDECPENKKA